MTDYLVNGYRELPLFLNSTILKYNNYYDDNENNNRIIARELINIETNFIASFKTVALNLTKLIMKYKRQNQINQESFSVLRFEPEAFEQKC